MIRQAKIGDVDAIVNILRHYAERGLLLPRTRQSVCETVMAFRVIELDHQVVGTAALHILGDDLAEIRSLAVLESAQGYGWGRRLVDVLFADAEQLEIPQVLTLTYQQSFFTRCGFQVVDKGSLQRKIWKDCIHCKKFPVCDEIAMIRPTQFHDVRPQGADVTDIPASALM